MSIESLEQINKYIQFIRIVCVCVCAVHIRSIELLYVKNLSQIVIAAEESFHLFQF